MKTLAESSYKAHNTICHPGILADRVFRKRAWHICVNSKYHPSEAGLHGCWKLEKQSEIHNILIASY